MKIVLIGFMGCGKSSVGKALAKHYGMQFVDMDDLICEVSRKSIAEIFAAQGETGFRAIETEIAKRLEQVEHTVIGTGGGAPTIAATLELLRANNALIFYLEVPLERLKARLGDTSNRPLWRDAEALAQLYQQRLPLYRRAATQIVNGDQSIEEVCSEISIAIDRIGKK